MRQGKCTCSLSIRARSILGRSLGTSSTAGGTTTFYDARGNVTGRTTPPR
jgi:hypothetical protein